MAPPTVAIATQAHRRRSVENDGRMTARRCQLGPARKPNRGADALQPDLAVDPPERLRCLTTAVEEPGSERPQEERLANKPSADSARPDSARWSGARRVADLRAVRQDRDAVQERGEHRRRGYGRPRQGQQPPHYGGGSVVSHVGNGEDFGCGQCRRLGRSSKTEGRQDDFCRGVNRAAFRRVWAQVALGDVPVKDHRNLLLLRVSRGPRGRGLLPSMPSRQRAPDHRVIVGLPTIGREPDRFDDVRFVRDPAPSSITARTWAR